MHGLAPHALHVLDVSMHVEFVRPGGGTPRMLEAGGRGWHALAHGMPPTHPRMQAAVRGLQEELGIRASPADLEGPLAPTHMRDLVAPNFHDKELVQSFLLRCSEPPAVAIDEAEVQATRWIAVQDLRGEVQRAAENFTAWILAEGTSLGWLDRWLGGAAATGPSPTADS